MFRQLSNQLAAAAKTTEVPKAIAPTLRSDIYTAIDQTKSWLIGGLGQAGDGMSYGPVLATIQKHFPETKMGLENIGSAENEVSVVVCGVTNSLYHCAPGRYCEADTRLFLFCSDPGDEQVGGHGGRDGHAHLVGCPRRSARAAPRRVQEGQRRERHCPRGQPEHRYHPDDQGIYGKDSDHFFAKER